jgi:hypothetical protein
VLPLAHHPLEDGGSSAIAVMVCLTQLKVELAVRAAYNVCLKKSIYLELEKYIQMRVPQSRYLELEK